MDEDYNYDKYISGEDFDIAYDKENNIYYKKERVFDNSNVLYSRVKNLNDIELDEKFKMHITKIVNDFYGKIFIFKENPVTSVRIL